MYIKYVLVYNNTGCSVICEDCHFTLMWKDLSDSLISLRGNVWAHKTSLTPPGFLLLKCMY